MSLQTPPPTDALAIFTSDGSDAPERAARFLKSLAHRDRLKVLCALVQGELPVSAIEAKVGASQSAVSQHLAKLKDEGVLTARRDGRQMFYSIQDEMVLNMIMLLYQRFCATDT
jgi:ArsR family transcriptional regulator